MAGVRARVDAILRSRPTYALAFFACATPGLVLGVQFAQVLSGSHPDLLGADPTKLTLHTYGRDALTLLLIALAITPIRRLTGLNVVQRFRRLIGVWAFVYAFTHFLVYLLFDQLCYSWSTCEFGDIYKDFLRRRFTIVGLCTLIILTALAVTSTNGWMRRLGRRWQTLHRLVYVAAVLAIVHFWWGQKSDYTDPMKYAAVLVVLFGVRLWYAVKKRLAGRALHGA